MILLAASDSSEALPVLLALLILNDVLLCSRHSFSTQEPTKGTIFEIQLPGAKRYAKCRDCEAVLAVHPRMNPESHGDEYYYGLLLQHWDKAQLIQPYATAEAALAAHCQHIPTDKHFTKCDLDEAIRRLRTLHDLSFHDADAQHDNEENDDPEQRIPFFFL